jgi:hypothetical protein
MVPPCRLQSHTRNVNEQNQLQSPGINGVHVPRWFDGLVDQVALTADSQWIQNEECVVSEPSDNRRLETAQGNHKV